MGTYKQARKIITHVSNSLIRIEITVLLNVLHRGLIKIMYKETVADPGLGGRGGVNCHKQGRSPCSRHEVASGGWVREGGVPPSYLDKNGNQEMLRGLLKHIKIRIL